MARNFSRFSCLVKACSGGRRVNERLRLIINKLFDDFKGKLQTSKWAKIAKTSTDTALRDIKDLVEKGILKQTDDKGRNVNYELVADRN